MLVLSIEITAPARLEAKAGACMGNRKKIYYLPGGGSGALVIAESSGPAV